MTFVKSVFTYAVSAYTNLLDWQILQATTSPDAPHISSEATAQVAGVLKDTLVAINLFSYNIWDDDRNLSRAVYKLIDLFDDYGRLSSEAYEYLDGAYLDYLDYMDRDGYEAFPDEWEKVLYIIRRHKRLGV